MKKIFINYSWDHNSKDAHRLYKKLDANKQFKLWMDKEDLQGGLKWRPAIRKAIRESDFFVSLLSKASIKGRGVRNREIYEALDILKEFPPNEIYLIPTLINDCEPPFDEMNELNRIKLFPNWNKGFSELLNSLGMKKPDKGVISEGVMDTSSNYHYRVGIVDLDLRLKNLDMMVLRLNKIQRYFRFNIPVMPKLKGMIQPIDGQKNFAVYSLPKSYIEEHKHLSVDLLGCLTKYPLAFYEDGALQYNYFAGPSDIDERFLFLSADGLNEYCKSAGCSFEEGIVYILVGQLITYFTTLGYHNQTRGCVMDFCEERDDIVVGLSKRTLCKNCNKKLPDSKLKESLLSLLNWKYS